MPRFVQPAYSFYMQAFALLYTLKNLNFKGFIAFSKSTSKLKLCHLSYLFLLAHVCLIFVLLKKTSFSVTQ